jgi:23S rRNA (uracil1939-C5)-methyltransferase
LDNKIEAALVTKISGYSHAGEGVGRWQGKPVFIPGAIKDEVVNFQITEEKKGYARGMLQSVLDTSSRRVEPPCEHYEICGGCQLQHLSYEEELSFKHDQVEAALQRIGGFKGLVVSPVLGMDNPWNYRHTARFHVKPGQPFLLGYHRQRSHELLPIRNCSLLPEEFPALLSALSHYLGEKWDYQRFPVSEVIIRKGWATGELLVQLLAERLPSAVKGEEARGYFQNFSTLVGLFARSTNRSAKSRELTIFGQSSYMDQICSTVFQVPADGFFQNNPAQAETLVNIVKSLGDPSPDVLLDLYCGAGLFAHTLAPIYQAVFGIEESRGLVASARQNALLNGRLNTSFYTGKVEAALPPLIEQGIKPSTVVLDPPRQGSTPAALATICRTQAAKILYVSCNPATLARDLAFLTQRGYQPDYVQPVDMFPHTHHVESVVLMSRANL